MVCVAKTLIGNPCCWPGKQQKSLEAIELVRSPRVDKKSAEESLIL